MHQAGAAALTLLLRYEPPSPEERELPCPRGKTAHYRELRSRDIVAMVGQVEFKRPYYLCSHCHNGQFPVDIELDMERLY